MEATYSCDHTMWEGQTYWRLDTKKNLSMVSIGNYLKMQPSVSELRKFCKGRPEAHLNSYYWQFKWDDRPCIVGMTDFERKREEPGAPKKKGADGKTKKEPGKRKRGQEHLYAQGDAVATAAVKKHLLDWLLPLELVHETALLPPHMRYGRESKPTRPVHDIPLPESQRASGSTEAPAGGAATSRVAAEPAPPPVKCLKAAVPPPPPLLPPKAMGARDPSPPIAPQTPEGWEAHPESGHGSTSASGCGSGGDGPGDSGGKPPLSSGPPPALPPRGATTFPLPNGDRAILPEEAAADFADFVGAPAGANPAERIQEHITNAWEAATGATAAPSAASGRAISTTEAVLEMSTRGPKEEEDQEKDEEEDYQDEEADYDRDSSPEPESKAGETSHGMPDIDMEALPRAEEAAFPDPEPEGPPSAERLRVLRALIGVRVSEKGQLDVEDVGWNLMPWNLLMNIRKEVAKEMQLDMSNAFGYAATRKCLDKYRILVWTACEKSEEGRRWMTKWPWQVVDQPRRPAPGQPGDLNNHRVKNVMKVLG